VTLLPSLLLAAAALAAGPIPAPIAELRRVESELEWTKRSVFDAQREASRRSYRWGALFQAGLRAKRKDPLDYERSPYGGGYSDGDRMFDEWKRRRVLEDPSLDEWALRSQWSAEFERWVRDYERALGEQEKAARLEGLRDWTVRGISLPPELPGVYARAAALMRSGRRDAAEALLREWEPWADVHQPLNLLLMEFEMARSPEFRYDRRRIHNSYLGFLHDREGRWRDLDWRQDCRHLQSLRFTDFLYPPLPGETPDLDYMKLAGAAGLSADPAAQAALRDFLSSHAGLHYDAVMAGRSRSPCRALRVDPSGRGDASSIAAALALLAPGENHATLVLEPGRYEGWARVEGLWNLTIRSRVPGAAVLAAPADGAALIVSGVNGLLLEGLSFDLSSGGEAARILDSAAVSFRRCRLSGPPSAGVTSHRSKGVYFWETEFVPES
jgi:hypothetical protein